MPIEVTPAHPTLLPPIPSTFCLADSLLPSARNYTTFLTRSLSLSHTRTRITVFSVALGDVDCTMQYLLFLPPTPLHSPSFILLPRSSAIALILIPRLSIDGRAARKEVLSFNRQTTASLLSSSQISQLGTPRVISYDIPFLNILYTHSGGSVEKIFSCK